MLYVYCTPELKLVSSNVGGLTKSGLPTSFLPLLLFRFLSSTTRRGSQGVTWMYLATKNGRNGPTFPEEGYNLLVLLRHSVKNNLKQNFLINHNKV